MHVPPDPSLLSITGLLAPRPATTLIQVLHHGYFVSSSSLNPSHLRADSGPALPSTLVSLRPITGRRHQLRVHLKLAGYPVIGDYTYEGESRGGDGYTKAPRMMLHATRIMLPLHEIKGWNGAPFVQADAGDCITGWITPP